MHWIFAHLIGDYILQNDWMGMNKKQKTLPCLVHVFLYCLPFLFTPLAYWKIILIGIEHFIQDRTNIVVKFMQLKGSKEFTKPPMAPWSVIITDNILHILFIALLANI